MPNPTALPAVVASYERPNGELVRAGFNTFKGRAYFSVRTFYRDTTGEWAPGRNGLNLPVDEFSDFFTLAQGLNEHMTGENLEGEPNG